MKAISTNYDKLYDQLKCRLLDCDFDDAAARLGLDRTENGIRAVLCGREYEITHGGVNALDGRYAQSNFKSVLIHYVTYMGFGEPSYSFVPLNRLTGMPDGRNELGGKMFTAPLERKFQGDHQAFARAAESISGYHIKSSGGRHDWQFLLLSKIPARAVFYEADDEFPTELQLFLDRRATLFLEFECLAFLVGCFTKALLEAGES